jgi:hypothetical protein
VTPQTDEKGPVTSRILPAHCGASADADGKHREGAPLDTRDREGERIPLQAGATPRTV